MTHIIISRQEKIQITKLLSLLSKYFEREIKQEDLSNIPDIHILRTDENSIGIEIVKEIQSKMIFKPFNSNYQFCIIFNSEKLTHEAQNALLKTLEESPDSTIYILLLNNEKNILDTILSRGLKHYPNQEKEDRVEEVPEILSLDFVEKFKKIEEISELETREILEYVSGFQKYFQEKLREDIKNGNDLHKNQKILEIINTAYTRLSANGNKKLVLENMFLQIEK